MAWPNRTEGPTKRRKPRTRRGAEWSQTGSNRRPPACKAGALPAELWPQARPSLARTDWSFMLGARAATAATAVADAAGEEQDQDDDEQDGEHGVAFRGGRCRPGVPRPTGPQAKSRLGPAAQVAPLVQRLPLAQRRHGAHVDVEVVRRVRAPDVGVSLKPPVARRARRAPPGDRRAPRRTARTTTTRRATATARRRATAT